MGGVLTWPPLLPVLSKGMAMLRRIIVSLSFDTGKSKIPALARISWLSVCVSRDKGHVFKWFVIASLQPSRQTDYVTPLEFNTTCSFVLL